MIINVSFKPKMGARLRPAANTRAPKAQSSTLHPSSPPLSSLTATVVIIVSNVSVIEALFLLLLDS